ncbi:hypothetical protein B0H63DRAFT_493866 [Podospora didyma]|uniref:Heterokaryon incompatibility domain-containing protein n=1 Tax=Podospora didyma TaxID=330526 RepID=A0AAE0NU72_9PEZI|nr:hypothetical protein B0H63DRAFT_493866 [Podospora didyma]
MPSQYYRLDYQGNITRSLKTTKANMSSLREAISASKLPQTFMDAICVTRGLGLGFIWIDSLCIIQDDHAGWERESGRMASIFQKAFLTLAATHSPNNNGGLFTPFGAKPYLCIWETLKMEKKLPVQRTFFRHFALCPADDIRNSPTKGRSTDFSNNLVAVGYPLLTRAWAFQERLLSPRVCDFWTESLVFTTDVLRGQLTRQNVHENPNLKYPVEGTRREFTALTHETGSTASPHDHQKSQSVSNLPAIVNGHGNNILQTWKTLVEDYSRLDMTDEMDCLPALSGIATSIHSSLTRIGDSGAAYLAGLWSSKLPYALCWICVSENSKKPARYRAPSFSRASFNGPISFREPLTFKRGLDFDSFSSQPKGLARPYGRRSIGYVSRVYITKKGTAYILSPQIGADNDGMRQKFWPDITPADPSDGSKDESHPSVATEVRLLLLGAPTSPYRVMCLVLRPAAAVEGAWERIGLIYPADDTAMYLEFRDDLAADIGADRSMFERPSSWFTDKQTLLVA